MELKRYNCWEIDERGYHHAALSELDNDGEWCLYEDAAAEIARLRSELSIANRSLRYYQDTLTIGDMGKYWALEGGGATAAIDPERLGDVLKERDRLRVQVEHFRAKNCGDCDRIASEEGEAVRERLINENRELKARVAELEANQIGRSE